MKNFREQIGNYEQENVSLRKEISSLNTNYGRLKEENQELNNMVAKLREQIENKRCSFKDTPGVGDSEFDEYKIATEALISDYKARIKEFERKNDELIQDLDNIAQEKEESESDYFK